MGLSFTIAVGPRQRSHSRVRVPWDSWLYFTVSESHWSQSQSYLTTGGLLPISSSHRRTSAPYRTSDRTAQKTPFLTNFSIVASRLRCHGNLFIEPLPSKGRLFWLHYSSLQSLYHSIMFVQEWLKEPIPLYSVLSQKLLWVRVYVGGMGERLCACSLSSC
jgi:hypothetical protein